MTLDGSEILIFKCVKCFYNRL